MNLISEEERTTFSRNKPAMRAGRLFIDIYFAIVQQDQLHVKTVVIT